MRRIVSQVAGSSQEITIQGICVFTVSTDGREILLRETLGAPTSAMLTEAALGPGLMLALAIRGVFCMHASGVMLGDAAVLFLGDSTAGKSTLARLLPDDSGRLLRITDDISPLIQGEDGRFCLLPDFPQLKLAAAEQFDWRQGASMSIRAFMQLDRTSAGVPAHPAIRARRLSGVEAFRVLAGQSVASRLFPSDLLRQHTQLLGELVQQIPVFRLTYPSGPEHIPALRGWLEAMHETNAAMAPG